MAAIVYVKVKQAMPNANAADSLLCVVIAWMSALLNRIIQGVVRPAPSSIVVGAVVDLSRSKADLVAENALVRHQLALLKRQSKRPKNNVALSRELHVVQMHVV